MPTFEVEVTADLHISSARITVEAESFEAARQLVVENSWAYDDLRIVVDTDLQVSVDWVNCYECGGEGYHEDHCKYAEAEDDPLVLLGL